MLIVTKNHSLSTHLVLGNVLQVEQEQD